MNLILHGGSFRAVALVWSVACAAPAAQAQIAITHVAVVDVERGRVDADRTVVVAGNRIASVTGAAKALIPAGARRVDGTGRFLIPGLWDMAAYAINFRRDCNAEAFALYVANGVAGVRDIGSSVPLAAIRAFKDSVARHLAVGPRLLAPGPGLGGATDNMYPNFTIPTWTEADARRQVDSLAAAGADYIKFYQYMPKALLPMVLATARSHHLLVSGALAWGFKEAADGGLRIIDHPADLRRSVTLDRAVYAARYEGRTRAGADSLAARELARMRGAAALDTITDPSKRDYAWFAALRQQTDTAYYRATLATLARDSVWLVTNTPDYAQSVFRFEYADPVRAEFRTHAANVQMFHDVSTGRFPTFDDYDDGVRGTRSLYAQLRAAHVSLAAGTQLGCGPHNTPGMTVHDELLWQTEGGYTPAEALRSATIGPATMFHMADSLGTIAPGKIADLVLLDANPLDRIEHVRRIRAVVLDGRLFDRAALDGLVERARSAVR